MDEETKADLIQRMRSHGRSLSDRGFMEDSLEESSIRWTNDYVLQKTGWTLAELQAKPVSEIMPERYHSELRERAAGKRAKFFIFPFRTADDNICWWFAQDHSEFGPLHWSVGKHIITTSGFGSEFELMHSMMETTNMTGEVLLQHEDHNKWARNEVDRLDAADAAIRKELTDAKTRAVRSEQIAREAVNQTLETNETLKSFRAKLDGFEKEIRASLTTMEGLEERVTDGIIRLMRTDEFYSRQAAAVRGLTKNIILSVAAIVAAGVLAQAVMSKWGQIIGAF